MDKNLKFYLEELIKHKDDLEDALGIAGCEQVCGFNREKEMEIKKLIDNIAPYIDPDKYTHRVGSLLHFPQWVEAEEILNSIVDNMKVVPKVKAENQVVYITIIDIEEKYLTLIPMKDRDTVVSIMESCGEIYFNRLRNADLFDKDQYKYEFQTAEKIKYIEEKLKEAVFVADKHYYPMRNDINDNMYNKDDREDINRITPLIKLIREKLLEPYIPYNGFEVVTK